MMSPNLNTSKTLRLMGLTESISDSNNLFPPVKWDDVKHRITEYPEEAFISPMPCPPLQFGKKHTTCRCHGIIFFFLISLTHLFQSLTALVNNSSPVPVHVVEAFLTANPTTLQDCWYKISVIAVCQNKCIEGDVLKLLLETGPRETLIPSISKSLFPFAIKSENIEVLKVLIHFFPWVLSRKNTENDEIPLHNTVYSSPELIEFLLQQGIRHQVGGHDSVGGLFLQNGFGETLFDNLVSAVTVANPFDNQSQIMKWKRLEVCIKYANFAREGSAPPISCKKPSFSCIGFIPSYLVDRAFAMIDFEFVCSDIFSLIEMATTPSVWKQRFGLDEKDLSKIISSLLHISEGHERIENQYLHFSARKGLKWESGLKVILYFDFGSLSKIDKHTNLIPYLAAASGPSYDLDAIYELLRRDPSQV